MARKIGIIVSTAIAALLLSQSVCDAQVTPYKVCNIGGQRLPCPTGS